MRENGYLAQAKVGRNDFWRYLLVNGAVIGVSIVVSVVLVMAAFLVEGTLDYRQFSPLTMLLAAMLPFPFALLTLWIGVRFLHGRSMRSLLTVAPHIQWRRFLFSALVWFVVSGLVEGVLSLLQPGNYQFSFNLERSLPYFLVALILIPLQTSTEELIFRGYLPQSLGLLTSGIWLPWIVPAIVFGLLHGMNPEVGLYGMALMLPSYILMGLLLGWITLRSQGLELALGLHLANNLYAGLMVTFPGSSLTSPAIFSIREFDVLAATVGLLVSMAVYLGVAYGLGALRPPKL